MQGLGIGREDVNGYRGTEREGRDGKGEGRGKELHRGGWAIDESFAELFQSPAIKHKVLYYHSVIHYSTLMQRWQNN